MLKSMTAYASIEKRAPELAVGIEMRSYNSRHLDIALRMPHGYASLEEKVKNAISTHMVRGRIEVRLWIKDTSESAEAFEVDVTRARAFLTAVQTLKEQLQLNGDLSLERLIDVGGVIQPAESTNVVEGCWPHVEAALGEALVMLDRMRRQEGAHIAEDFSQRLALIESQLDQIEQAAEGLTVLYQERLRARIVSLTQGVVDLDPVRLAQEAAILADRSDISEEIVRARSHVLQFRAIMAGPEAAGRKLNFLLQEFNREFNTMGSKAGKADLAHLIVTAKAEIEKLREQVQNIE